MRCIGMALIVCLGASLSSTVNAECFGEDEYMVCSDVETDADGDIHARSWDTDGNTYHLDTELGPMQMVTWSSRATAKGIAIQSSLGVIAAALTPKTARGTSARSPLLAR